MYFEGRVGCIYWLDGGKTEVKSRTPRYLASAWNEGVFIYRDREQGWMLGEGWDQVYFGHGELEVPSRSSGGDPELARWSLGHFSLEVCWELEFKPWDWMKSPRSESDVERRNLHGLSPGSLPKYSSSLTKPERWGLWACLFYGWRILSLEEGRVLLKPKGEPRDGLCFVLSLFLFCTYTRMGFWFFIIIFNYDKKHRTWESPLNNFWSV